MTLRFSLFETPVSPGPEHDERIVDDMIRLGAKMDRAGFATLYLAEHHFSGYSTYGNNFMLGSYLAAATTQLHIGFGVAVVPLHHPARLAEQANLLDLLAKGRFLFGIGSGGIPLESVGLGIEPDGRHHDRMMETMDIVEALWAHTDDDPPYEFATEHFKGTLYQRIMPRSHTQPHPIVKQAGSREASVRNAARRGWAVFITPFFGEADGWDNLVRWWDIYRSELDAAGHDDETVERCLRWSCPRATVAIGNSMEEITAQRMAGGGGPGAGYLDWVRKQLAIEERYLGRDPAAGHGGPGGGGPPPMVDPFAGPHEKGVCMGTPEMVAEGLADYAELGFSELMLGGLDAGIGTDRDRTGEHTDLDRFIEEVMPLI